MPVLTTAMKRLVRDQQTAFVATVNADGTPQVTPVWFSYDGTHIWVNSAKGRLKDKNMRRNNQVALSIQDPDNHYRYLAIQGEVDEITENGADAQVAPGPRILQHPWRSLETPRRGLSSPAAHVSWAGC